MQLFKNMQRNKKKQKNKTQHLYLFDSSYTVIRQNADNEENTTRQKKKKSCHLVQTTTAAQATSGRANTSGPASCRRPSSHFPVCASSNPPLAPSQDTQRGVWEKARGQRSPGLYQNATRCFLPILSMPAMSQMWCSITYVFILCFIIEGHKTQEKYRGMRDANAFFLNFIQDLLYLVGFCCIFIFSKYFSSD